LCFGDWNPGFSRLCFCLFMLNMFATMSTIFLKSKLFRGILLVLRCGIVFVFTACTL
jgi:hypothetical protein